MKSPTKRRSPNARSHTDHRPNRPTNQVRIIGGMHRRRLISFIDANGLRPTPDRLRETIFNWLTGHLTDARVLDVCAGSGALAFEALSRGAADAVLIEANAAQAKQLIANAELLNLSASTQIIHGASPTALDALQGPFDLIFIDPPYALDLWQPILNTLIDLKLIHENSLIYLEADRDIDAVISADLLRAFTLIKATQVGQAHAYLMTPMAQEDLKRADGLEE